MAESVEYVNGNGKTVLTKSPLSSPACLLSSEHLALASTSVPVQGRLFLSVCLSSALSCSWSWSCALRLFETLCCLWRILSRQAILNFFFTSLSQRFGLCVSVVHTTTSFFFFFSSEYNRVTKCLEWCFTTFIDLDFKPLVCFEEYINQRNWHQQAFHWVQKKRAPLKIARKLL